MISTRRTSKKGLQLYSSGVMIMENCEELLPDCFRFVCGVVDSQDLSLNISREMLQHDRQLKFIAGNLEKKIKAELAKLMEQDREKHEKFYAAFGMQIKYGVLNDYGAKKGSFAGPASLLVAQAEQARLLQGIRGRHARGAKVHLFASGETGRDFLSCRSLRSGGEGLRLLLMTDEVGSFLPQTLGKVCRKGLPLSDREDLALSTDEEKERSRRAG